MRKQWLLFTDSGTFRLAVAKVCNKVYGNMTSQVFITISWIVATKQPILSYLLLIAINYNYECNSWPLFSDVATCITHTSYTHNSDITHTHTLPWLLTRFYEQIFEVWPSMVLSTALIKDFKGSLKIYENYIFEKCCSMVCTCIFNICMKSL